MNEVNTDRFYGVTEGARLAMCGACGCVIVDDDEGSNRYDHMVALHSSRALESREVTP